MALGLQTGSSGGEARPFIKFDARAGRMFRVDRAQGADGTWSSTPVDITSKAAFIPDLENIEVGWINYSEQGPIRSMSILGKSPMPDRPSGSGKDGKPAFKQGFNMQLALSKDVGGGVREFSSTAGCVIEAIDELHNAFIASAEGKSGKLPVVRIAETIPVKSGQSTNYKPVFQIDAWVERPEGLKGPTATPAAVQTRATPPATGSTQVAAPAAVAPTSAEAAASRDFG